MRHGDLGGTTEGIGRIDGMDEFWEKEVGRYVTLRTPCAAFADDKKTAGQLRHPRNPDVNATMEALMDALKVVARCKETLN